MGSLVAKRKMRTSLTGEPGFTLVELIVVIVIVSVLATMIAPRLYTATGSARLRSSASRLLVTAQYARSFAATHRCACRLLIDPAEGRYGLTCQYDPEAQPDEFRPLRTGVGKAESLAPGLRFSKLWIKRQDREETSQQVGCITFRPSGQADAAVVEITDGRRRVSMLLGPCTGQAELVEGIVQQLPNDRVDLDE